MFILFVYSYKDLKNKNHKFNFETNFYLNKQITFGLFTKIEFIMESDNLHLLLSGKFEHSATYNTAFTYIFSWTWRGIGFI